MKTINMKNEKLNPINKIVLATGSINYMAAHIHTIRQQMLATNLQHEGNPHKQSLHDQKQTFNRTLMHLENAMEELMSYLDGYDCLTDLDVTILNPPFDVIVEGNDDMDQNN